MLADFPPQLRNEMVAHMYGSMIASLPFFRKLEEDTKLGECEVQLSIRNLFTVILSQM